MIRKAMAGSDGRLMACVMGLSLFLCTCGEPGNGTHSDQASEEQTTVSMQPDESTQATTAEARPEEQPLEESERAEEAPGDDVSRDTITVEITPLRTSVGIIYGAEARDKASGTLLATAKQVAMNGDILVVEETQYSRSGDVVYEGKLFFSAGNELVNEERTRGEKRWNVFQRWISDSPGF